MYHQREEVIKRITHEFDLLDRLVTNLRDEEWDRSLLRPETKDLWTVKDALAHITFWKANAARSARHEARPEEERGLNTNAINHLVFIRWRDRSAQEVLEWHWQVQQEVLATLREAPDDWFSKKERNPQWPFDLDGHSSYHRLKDIERVLNNESSQ